MCSKTNSEVLHSNVLSICPFSIFWATGLCSPLPFFNSENRHPLEVWSHLLQKGGSHNLCMFRRHEEIDPFRLFSYQNLLDQVGGYHLLGGKRFVQGPCTKRLLECFAVKFCLSDFGVYLVHNYSFYKLRRLYNCDIIFSDCT